MQTQTDFLSGADRCHEAIHLILGRCGNKRQEANVARFTFSRVKRYDRIDMSMRGQMSVNEQQTLLSPSKVNHKDKAGYKQGERRMRIYDANNDANTWTRG